MLAACQQQSAPAFNSVDITGANYARDFALTDQTGSKKTLADFRGKVVLVFFGYTQCPDVCPTTMADMAQVKAKLGSAGDKLQVIYDMPLGVGEPHYAQLIRADKLRPWTIYPEIGWDPHKQAVDATAPKAGSEGVTREGDKVTILMTASRSHFTPEHVKVRQGDKVTWRITNIERTEDATHGFTLPGYNTSLSLEPGETVTFTFDAVNSGVYPWYCSEFCSALHLEMMGYFLVEPTQSADASKPDAETLPDGTH